jgi:radical SAM protein with 4Fe4S-binding SPASM domain
MLPAALRNVERIPKHAIWEITAACNMRCIHCEGSAGRRDPSELTTGEALALCDELAAAGCEQCNLSGGEPMLRKDWPVLVERLARAGIQVALVTNGSRINQQTVQQALDAGLRSVALSLDGLRETHDRIRPFRSPRGSSFDDVMAAAELLRETRMEAAFITHVNRWNFDELEAMHELLGAKAAAHWQLQLGVPLGRQRELEVPYMIAPGQLPLLAERLVAMRASGKAPLLRVTDTIGYYTACEPLLRLTPEGAPAFWTGCWAGILAVGIESNGTVKGCSSLPHEFAAGNVRDRPFRQIWADDAGFAYNRRWDESGLTGYCARCSYRRVCRAGCTSLAFSVTGTVYDNPFCLHRVAMTRESPA